MTEPQRGRQNFAGDAIEREATAEGTILLQRPSLPSGDTFDIRFSPELLIDLLGLSFPLHALMLRQEKTAETAETTFWRFLAVGFS
jgi:hypothetical protein